MNLDLEDELGETRSSPKKNKPEKQPFSGITLKVDKESWELEDISRDKFLEWVDGIFFGASKTLNKSSLNSFELGKVFQSTIYLQEQIFFVANEKNEYALVQTPNNRDLLQ